MNEQERIIISDAAWAWEGLRRNKGYRQAWERQTDAHPRICDNHASLRYVKTTRPSLEAEVFGLVAFADPEHLASEVPVFWRPSLLRRTLSVSLAVQKTASNHGFSLASLKCCPTVLDTVEGQRHIRLGGHHFWIQLVSDDLTRLDDDTSIEVNLTGATGLPQRISSVAQLFALHQSGNGVPPPVRRPPNRDKLLEGLLAWDIYGGHRSRQGSLREVAIALVGHERVELEWGHNRSLKDRAVRARDRGRAFVEGGYLDLLQRTNF